MQERGEPGPSVLQGRKGQQKRKEHLFANVASKKHTALTLFPSSSAWHRVRWGFPLCLFST